MHLRVLDGLSTAAQGISYAVEGAGLLVGLVRGIVRDLIADFIGTLAVRLPEWLAEAGLTLGIATPVVIGQVGALVAKWANKIQHFVRGLLRSLARLHPRLGRLGELLTGLNRYSDDLADTDIHPPGSPAAPPPPSRHERPAEPRMARRRSHPCAARRRRSAHRREAGRQIRERNRSE
jgi:hypothetical protein